MLAIWLPPGAAGESRIGAGRKTQFGEALAVKPRMIDVPQVDKIAAETVQQRRQPFSDFVTDPANSRILRDYVGDWMTHVRAEFDRVGIGLAAEGLSGVS